MLPVDDGFNVDVQVELATKPGPLDDLRDSLAGTCVSSVVDCAIEVRTAV